MATGHMTPIFVDASVRTYLDEEPSILFGGSLRFEVEKNAGVALVPRVELRQKLRSIELRPGVALPVFFTPRTMLGPEVSVAIRYKLGPQLGLLGMGTVSAFFFGNDVPEGTTVLMFNLIFGVNMEL